MTQLPIRSLARGRAMILARRTKPRMRVLNIGVGRGGLEAILYQKGAVVRCLDPSERCIENIRELLGAGRSGTGGFLASNAIR